MKDKTTTAAANNDASNNRSDNVLSPPRLPSLFSPKLLKPTLKALTTTTKQQRFKLTSLKLRQVFSQAA